MSWPHHRTAHRHHSHPAASAAITAVASGFVTSEGRHACLRPFPVRSESELISTRPGDPTRPQTAASRGGRGPTSPIATAAPEGARRPTRRKMNCGTPTPNQTAAVPDHCRPLTTVPAGAEGADSSPTTTPSRVARPRRSAPIHRPMVTAPRQPRPDNSTRPQTAASRGGRGADVPHRNGAPEGPRRPTRPKTNSGAATPNQTANAPDHAHLSR